MAKDNFIRDFITQKTLSVIRKVGNEFCIFSKDGKKLECKKTRKEAVDRLRQIEFFKNRNKS